MIIEIGTPNAISPHWLETIEQWHKFYFNNEELTNPTSFWWLADIRQGVPVAFAGSAAVAPSVIFLGPCMVDEKWRQRGIQKELIRHRESDAKGRGFLEGVALIHYKNYVSLNNFIASGYRIGPPWNLNQIDNGSFIFLRKHLKGI